MALDSRQWVVTNKRRQLPIGASIYHSAVVFYQHSLYHAGRHCVKI